MSVERVNYFDYQYLRVDDFRDEQAYQLAMHRRHNIAQHSWGIVAGLEPRLVEGALYVTPGIAVDVFGREIILDKLARLPLELFPDIDAGGLEAWIEYSTTLARPPLEGYKTADSEQYYRIQEVPQVSLSKATGEGTPRMPAGADSANESFGPTEEPPENGVWPIFLGTITPDPKNVAAPYKLDLTGRPYAGLVGEAITAPSGNAKVQIGSENPADPVRFAVFVPAESTEAVFRIQQDGRLSAYGETTLEGSLTLTEGGLEFGEAAASTPQPWRMYRVREQDAFGAFRNELRIEMAGGGAGNNQILFGSWSTKDKKFKPSLTIADDGTVTVAGNLVVQGRLEINPAEVIAGQLTPEAKSMLAASAVSGMGAAELGEVAAREPHAGFDAKMREVLTHLEHPDHLKAFVAAAKGEFGKIASKLKSELQATD